MEDLKAEQKQEAVYRMEMLNMHRNAIREFTKGKLNLSEGFGALYWLNDEQNKIVKDFEEEHDAVVYHVIHNITQFGELYSLLYVSKDKEEWYQDRQDIQDGTPYAYVVNVSAPDCSEFGCIGIKPSIGGLIRTA